MAAPKRKPHEMQRDLLLIEHLYVQGKTLQGIADYLNARTECDYDLSVPQISLDLKKVKAGWRQRVDRHILDELARIDLIEANLWQEWERSKQNAEMNYAKLKADGSHETSKRSEGQCGDPRYMGLILDCVEKRCKLMGFYDVKEENKNKLPNEYLDSIKRWEAKIAALPAEDEDVLIRLVRERRQAVTATAET